MSLAEELLADLEDNDDDFDLAAASAVEPSTASSGGFGAALDRCLVTAADVDMIDEVTEEDEAAQTGAYQRVTDVARLRHSGRFADIMRQIYDAMNDEDQQKTKSLTDSDPEYQLIVEANNISVEIDNELNVIHKFVRDKYAKRFPELESLVPAPLEYIACVKELGNDILDKAKNSEALHRILLPATVIVVSVTASTTQGDLLADEELDIVEEACDMAEELNDAKLRIFQFVEQRMAIVAPNLCQVVGAGTAAKLMGVAGGLRQLCKMPACNVLLLGAQKAALSGFSSTAILPHTGFVYYTVMVQTLPPDLRKKAARLVAAKCTLAARVDACRESRLGTIGAKLAEEVTSKFDKWQEPPPIKQVKALPKPLDQASKKRGGRRIRKMKERLGLTDMRSKAQRMTFGDIQEDVFQQHMGVTLGQMKHGGTTPTPGGRIRAARVDEKSRARMSQKLQRHLARQNATSGGGVTAASSGASTSATVGGRRTVVAGTASTVTFTPVQGLEIASPAAMAADKRQSSVDAKYFGASSGFFKVGTQTPVGATSSTRGIIGVKNK